MENLGLALDSGAVPWYNGVDARVPEDTLNLNNRRTPMDRQPRLYLKVDGAFRASVHEQEDTMPKIRTTANPGSISHGTLRPEDLIPVFMSYLEDHDPLAAARLEERWLSNTAWPMTPAGGMDLSEMAISHSDSGTAALLEDLSDALAELAPDGHYFGSHEGDGSDFGFWFLPDEEPGLPLGTPIVRIHPDLTDLTADPWKVKPLSYGWAITNEDTGFHEWEFVVTATSRQDGKTAWMVALTEVDGNVTMHKGLVPWDQAADHIAQAIALLAKHWTELPFIVVVDRTPVVGLPQGDPSGLLRLGSAMVEVPLLDERDGLLVIKAQEEAWVIKIDLFRPDGSHAQGTWHSYIPEEWAADAYDQLTSMADPEFLADLVEESRSYDKMAEREEGE
jgi:hypothetical protein